VGLSHRVSNLNPQCQPANESRLCQLRACEEGTLATPRGQARHHHVRVSHLSLSQFSDRNSEAVEILFGVSVFFLLHFVHKVCDNMPVDCSSLRIL